MVILVVSESVMTVRCEGDSRVMQQLGEKQDFEAELSRLGFSHDTFMLDVRRVDATYSDRHWNANYTVCVANTATKRQNVYWGGPGRRWVAEFAADASCGIFGSPEMSELALRRRRVSARPRLVAGGAKRS